MTHTLDRLTREQVIEALPHGSGIDADWEGEEIVDGMTSVIFSCSYHGMNEGGYYDGWQDFTVRLFVHQEDVVIDLKGPCAGQTQTVHKAGDIDWELIMDVCDDDEDYAPDWLCGLDEYLGDTIQYALEEAGIIQ